MKQSQASQPQQPKELGGKPLTCFNCGDPGHFAGKCPKRKRNGPKIVQARVNHVSTEEAQAALEVVLGTFPANSIPAIVFFFWCYVFIYIQEICWGTRVKKSGT